MIDNQNHLIVPEETAEHTFITVCDESTALSKAYGPRGVLPVLVKSYSQEDHQKIRSQADKWLIRTECIEWYDYDFYANLGGEFKSYTESDIGNKSILVKNGEFFGVVISVSDPNTDMRYACAADYHGDPLLIYSYDEPKDQNDIENPSVSYKFFLIKREYE